MRKLRGAEITEAMFSSSQHIFWTKDARGSCGEVVDIDQGSNHVARGLGMRSDRQPFVKRATLVRLEVTPTNPTQACGVNNGSDTFAHFIEHTAKPGMKQKRLVVGYEEVVELKINLREKNADAIEIGCYFGDLGHQMTSGRLFRQSNLSDADRQMRCSDNQVSVQIAVRSGRDSNYCSSIPAIASGKLKGLPHSGHFDDPNR